MHLWSTAIIIEYIIGKLISPNIPKQLFVNKGLNPAHHSRLSLSRIVSKFNPINRKDDNDSIVEYTCAFPNPTIE